MYTHDNTVEPVTWDTFGLYGQSPFQNPDIRYIIGLMDGLNVSVCSL